MSSFIKVGSITHATKGKNILVKNGYKVYIKRSSNIDASSGCGYMLTFDGDINRAKILLEKGRITMLGSGTE